MQLGSALGQARLAQLLTIAWMIVEAVVAVGSGLAAHSLALTAFGFDSLIELFSSAVVLRRLMARSAEEERGTSTPGERTASRLVGIALYLLIAYIVAAAILGLFLHVRPQSSPIGIGLVVVALVVMAVLWRWRLALADRLDSPALRGDAACSVVCLYLAAATLVGLTVNSLMGWWWADPIAGLALIFWIRGEAREAIAAGGG
ncbi:MAG TPA: cation transporter [Candidatus Nitrosotalea sp.]|nr:cation transporter [Candidatus Nitrosotalea sp.]